MTMQLRVAALSLSLVVLAVGAAETPMPAASQHMRGSPILFTTLDAAAPDEAGTATNSTTEVPKIFQAVARIIKTELVDGPHQVMTAVLALIGGIVLVVDGKKVFDGFLCLALGYVLGVLVMSSVGDMWHLEHNSLLRKLVGWEIGLIGAWAAYKGLDGMNIFAGLLLGFWFTYNIQHVLVHLGAHFLCTTGGNQWLVVLMYTLFSGGFLYMFNGEAHKKLLALICPLIGGILVASATAYLFTSLVMTTFISTYLHKMSPDLHPVGGAWVEFFEMLTWPENKDVGIFANSPFNKFGKKWNLDRLAGWTIWFICWVCGVVLQLRKKTKKLDTYVAAAREPGLQQALLEKADK